jgi:hypothetical protein
VAVNTGGTIAGTIVGGVATYLLEGALSRKDIIETFWVALSIMLFGSLVLWRDTWGGKQ